MDSARNLILGLTVHHDYVNRRSHLGVTPAEASSLRIGLDGDAWRALVGLAARQSLGKVGVVEVRSA